MWWNSPRTLYIVRGLPGSGKTTLAKRIARHQVAADDYPGLYSSDGTYNQSLQASSHSWCYSMVQSWMQQRKRQIAVHNTFVENKYISPYLNLAELHGYTVHVIHSEIVLLPKNNAAISIHNVPLEIIESMRERWEAFNSLNKD